MTEQRDVVDLISILVARRMFSLASNKSSEKNSWRVRKHRNLISLNTWSLIAWLIVALLCQLFVGNLLSRLLLSYRSLFHFRSVTFHLCAIGNNENLIISMTKATRDCSSMGSSRCLPSSLNNPKLISQWVSRSVSLEAHENEFPSIYHFRRQWKCFKLFTNFVATEESIKQIYDWSTWWEGNFHATTNFSRAIPSL